MARHDPSADRRTQAWLSDRGEATAHGRGIEVATVSTAAMVPTAGPGVTAAPAQMVPMELPVVPVLLVPPGPITPAAR